jgi:lipid-A-disaccharide synthase
LKILISAAETSSDIHGAELLKALKTQLPEGVEAFGIGGPKLQAEGLRPVVDARELLSMGLTEVLGKLPKILGALSRLSSEAAKVRPDVVVVIDYPDFHFRLAKRLQAQGVPMVYFIPPKVWVWRKGRVRVLKELFDRVLCIFPFEEEFYRREGVKVNYVGNPLLDELPLNLSKDEARKRLGYTNQDRVIVAMPGSRPSELKRHLELQLDALKIVAKEQPARLRVRVPLPETAEAAPVEQGVATWLAKNPSPGFEIRVSRGDSAESLVAADAAFVKSGTSTLEAALLRCPQVVVYRMSWLSESAFKYIVRYRGPVGLVNLVLGWKPGEPFLATELIMEDMTPARMAEELLPLLEEGPRKWAMLDAYDRLRERLGAGDHGPSPSQRAAHEVIAVARAMKGPAHG